jgi:hypothetical protein
MEICLMDNNTKFLFYVVFFLFPFFVFNFYFQFFFVFLPEADKNRKGIKYHKISTLETPYTWLRNKSDGKIIVLNEEKTWRKTRVLLNAIINKKQCWEKLFLYFTLYIEVHLIDQNIG